MRNGGSQEEVDLAFPAARRSPIRDVDTSIAWRASSKGWPHHRLVAWWAVVDQHRWRVAKAQLLGLHGVGKLKRDTRPLQRQAAQREHALRLDGS